MPIDDSWTMIEDTQVTEEGPGDEWEEIDTAYEVFKDADGKVYKVSEETKEEFLTEHPGAEVTTEEGPLMYDESYLADDIEQDDDFDIFSPTDFSQVEETTSGSAIDEYNANIESEDPLDSINEYMNYVAESTDDEDEEDIYSNLEVNQPNEITTAEDMYLPEGEDKSVQKALHEEFVDIKVDEAKEEFVDAYGEDATNAITKGFIDVESTPGDLLRYDENTKYNYNIWTEEFEQGKIKDFRNQLAVNKGTLNEENVDLLGNAKSSIELENLRNEASGREGRRMMNIDIATISDKLEKEYISEGYTITNSKNKFASPLKSISKEELNKLALVELQKDQENHIEKYASESMIRAHKLAAEYKAIVDEHGVTSSQARTKYKEYNAIREDMASGALPMFDASFENYLKKRPELKEQMDSEAEEIAKTTDRQSIENEMMALYYEQVYMNKVMVEGGGIDRINEGIGLSREFSLFRQEADRGEDYVRTMEWDPKIGKFVAPKEKLGTDLVTGNKIDLPTQFDIERMMANDKDGVAGNRLPYPTTVLPENNAFTEYYNKKMLRYQTLAKALYGNYDPSTLPQTGVVDHFIYGALNLMGTSEGDPQRQSGDKIAKEYVEAIQYLRGDDAVTPEELERAEDRTRDLISAGTPEFMALMGIMASVKAPAAGMLGRLSTLGGRLVGMGETNVLARAFQTARYESLGLGTEAAAITVAESPATAYVAETVVSALTEVAAGVTADKTLSNLAGGHEMGWQLWAGFGIANPLSKRLINKILTPVQMGEAKGLINLNKAYKDNKAFQAIVNNSVSATVAIPTTVAVELFDANYIDTDNPDKNFANITDPEKLFILWSQLMLTGAFSSRLDYATGIRRYGEQLGDAIMGYSSHSPSALKAAKNQGLGSKNTNAELQEIYKTKEQELYEQHPDQVINSQVDNTVTSGPEVGSELAVKLKQLETDIKTLTFHNEVIALKKQIGDLKNPNGVYEQAKKKGDELWNAISEHNRSAPENTPFEFTTEQIDYLAETPQTLIDMAITGDTRSKEAIDGSIQLAAAKKQALSYTQALSDMGYKRNTPQRAEALKLMLESQKLNYEKIALQKESTYGSQSPVVINTALEVNKARQKEIGEIMIEKNKANKEYLETMRMEDIKKAEAEAKKYYPDSEFKTFESTKEYLDFAKEMGVDAKGSEGFFIDKGTGKVYIDLQRAREINNITVGSHEVLHQLLEPQLRDAKVTERLVEEFKRELSWTELQAVEAKMSKQALENQTPKEWFNAFNDAIRDGDIPPPTRKTDPTWKRMGTSLTNLFKKGGASNAEFKTGRDVYNYIVDYATDKGVTKVKDIKSQPETGKMAASRTRDISKELKELVPEWKKAEGPEKTKLKEKMKALTEEKASIEKAGNRQVNDFKKIIRNFEIKNAKGKEKIINDLVERDGKRLTNAEWREILYTDLNPGSKKSELVLDKIAKMLDKSVVEGKLGGTSVTGGRGENTNTIPRWKAMEMLREELNQRNFKWQKIVEFDPQVNDSFSGYMNSIIHRAYQTTLENIGKLPKTKSLDDTYGDGKNVRQAESKELDPSELTDIALEKERLQKAKLRKEQELKKKGASQKAIEEAADRSTMKTTVELSKPEQTAIKEFTEAIVKNEIKNIEGGDFNFVDKPVFRKAIIDKFSKEFLDKIPHPSQQSVKDSKKGKTPKEVKEINEKAKADYKNWLKTKLYPEVVKRNKPIAEGGDPAIFRRMRWDVMYEPTGKKYTAAEAKKIQVEQGIKSTTSQRAEYREKTPSAQDFVDYILHEGKYKNAKSRPNEKRLRIGDFLAETIGADALVDVIKNSKNITEFDKNVLLRQNALSKVSEILRKDPSISFSQTLEIGAKEGLNFSEVIDLVKITKGRLDKPAREMYEKIEKILKDQYIREFKEAHNLKDFVIAEKDFDLSGDSWKEYSKKYGLKYVQINDKLNAENLSGHIEVSQGLYDNFEKLVGNLNNPALEKILSAMVPTVGINNLKWGYKMENGVVKFKNLTNENFALDGVTPSGKVALQRFINREKTYDSIAMKLYGDFYKNLTSKEKTDLKELWVELEQHPKTNFTLQNIKSEFSREDLYSRRMYNKKFDKLTESQRTDVMDAIEGGFPVEIINRVGEHDAISEAQQKRIDLIRYAYQPTWGYGGKSPAFKGKMENLMKKLKKDGNYEQFIEGARDALTHPKLRHHPLGYEKTMEANDAVKNMFYEALNTYYNSFKTAEGRKKAESQIANFMQNQTNVASGLNKGFFSMESVTTRPEAKLSGKHPNIKTHNEHMTDLLASNQLVLNLMRKLHGNEKAFSDALKIVSKDFKQGLISKRSADIKDSPENKGAGSVSSQNYLLNTFLSNRTAGEQIFLGGPNRGKTVKQVLMETYSRKSLLDRLTKIPEKQRTTDVVELIQQLEYKSNFDKAFNHNEKSLQSFSKTRDPKNIREQVETMSITDRALELGRKLDKIPKKARIFDFDDTVARTKSNVLYTMPNGKKGKITPAEFAKKGEAMEAKGAKWDFSEFNKVVDGKKGPLFDLMKKMKDAAGERDMFILTARAPEAVPAIHKFLKEMGIDIPMENIKGLGDSSPNAKAEFIVEKAAKGFNDFYFADDHMANVKAVKEVLDQLDVKSKVQQAKFSKTIDRQFNEIIEQSSGVDWFKEFSRAKGEVVGKKKGRAKFFIPSSAEDLLGLTYTTLAKGKTGEKQLKWYKENVFDPYSRAMGNLSTDRVNLMNDFKQLKKELDVPRDLRKKNSSGFTNEQAVRVYLWDKVGEKIPGLSKSDLKELNKIIESDSKLQAFADQILSVTKGDGYSKPGKEWLAGTITSDLISLLNTTKRSKYLQDWQENVDVIYSEKNLNKLESIYGPKYREALEHMLTRMKAGRNRIESGNRLSNGVLNYINQAQGSIMFLNMRSALLQTISATNFINLGFNNPIKAGRAFANQKQYWTDFTKIMNSDYLVDRRNGLKLNIAENEIADAAKTSTNKAKAALNYIIEKGYLPTKFADSFAIASGGATFYRNKIKDLMKKDPSMELKEAERLAFKEFKEISELSQQSSDPSKISSQQSSDLGRLTLQFVNTPMQYARLQKRAAQDIIKGRGDWKSNLSRITYYGVMQNLWFNFMQQGVFALGFGESDDEKKDEKMFNMYNGMADSILRGIGLGGMTVSVIKNTVFDIYDRSRRTRPEYNKVWENLLGFSPAIKRKLTHIKGAAYPFDSKKRRAAVYEKGFSLDNPAFRSLAKVIEGTTALPLDRLYQKYENIGAALREDQEVWKSIAMFFGWPEWQIDKEGSDKAKNPAKQVSKPYYLNNQGKKIYY